MSLENQVKKLVEILTSLSRCRTLEEKCRLLRASTNRQTPPPFRSKRDEYVFLSVAVIGQESIVFRNKKPSNDLLQTLKEIDRFYESIGGIIGYHVTALKLITRSENKKEKRNISRAPGLDLSSKTAEVASAVYEGIEATAVLAEIYPVGGLGVRLNLQTKEGNPLPAACLPFLGRTLLEGLIRDVQAREYLYYKLFSKQVVIPIALMTSCEKRNHFHIEQICMKKNWFERPESSFFLFTQLLVPVITEEGNWSMLSTDTLNLDPGGHGALWRTAEEKGVFEWLRKLKKETLLIRQINNPIAGVDDGLFALIGYGRKMKKVFGFSSCERVVNAAEGVLVLTEKEGKKTISNIEYTDFESENIEDLPDRNGFSQFPANTNILYANLKKIVPAIKKNPLPGLILNMKTQVPFFDENGEKRWVRGGRLESMMQNIADGLCDPSGTSLWTFLTYNERKKTISTTKSSYEKGKKLLETPEGAFYDLLLNGYELLKICNFALPDFSSIEEYMEKGPSVLFLYHPALGPLYEIISQKMRGGIIESGSELQLEIAEANIENLSLSGSLLVNAINPLGKVEEGILHYGMYAGKCVLRNVKVENKGIDRTLAQTYWKNQIHRQEALMITLIGNAEFFAENVTFRGDLSFTIPSGERWIAEEGSFGKVIFVKEKIEKPTWQWNYRIEKNRVVLSESYEEVLSASLESSFS